MKMTIIFQKNRDLLMTTDDEDTLNILLPVLAGSAIFSDAKERKSRGPNRSRECV